MTTLPIHTAVRFVLVRPHYPENVGAAARAIKTMGFGDLAVVRPGRLASPEHEMARKMAVKSLDVLGAAQVHEATLDALTGIDVVVTTTSRRGHSGILTTRQLGHEATRHVDQGSTIAVLFGNEKTGLSPEDLALGHLKVRIPMAADQPSVNLAQSVQIVAYELFATALEATP